MSLDPIQQILTNLRQKKHLLITTRANPSGDSIAAALAFYLLAKKQGKQASIAIDNAALGLTHKCAFLPGYSAINPTVATSGKVLVEFELGGNNIRGLTYNVKDDKLLITITPEEKNLRLMMPAIKEQTYLYDLIVVLDTPDLESLGRIYDEHTAFFYEAPIINIDHQADNEHFGELNLVELTAVATTEVIFNLLEVWDKELIDPDIATCILTGIIAESNSFQSANITPRTLSIASELIAKGGRRDQVVAELYGNKPIKTLQLWGRALASLRTEPECGLLWSAVTADDFQATDTTEQDLRSIIDDLLTHAPQAKVVVLLYPRGAFLQAIIHTHRPSFDLRKIFSPLNPHGTRNFIECQITSPSPVEAIAVIKQTLASRAPRDELMPKF